MLICRVCFFVRILWWCVIIFSSVLSVLIFCLNVFFCCVAHCSWNRFFGWGCAFLCFFVLYVSCQLCFFEVSYSFVALFSLRVNCCGQCWWFGVHFGVHEFSCVCVCVCVFPGIFYILVVRIFVKAFPCFHPPFIFPKYISFPVLNDGWHVGAVGFSGPFAIWNSPEISSPIPLIILKPSYYAGV